MTVQYASSRRGVPSAPRLNQWAQLACAPLLPKAAGDEIALTIRIVGAAESRKLNRTWRGKDKPTNVLSFPSLPSPGPVNGQGRLNAQALRQAGELGDLAICAPVVAREAREQGKTAQSHWAHMVVHGVLHLFGFDHENDRDAEVMESREAKILAQFGFGNPYA